MTTSGIKQSNARDQAVGEYIDRIQRRGAPLLIDRLPLYATREEIAAAIVGSVGDQKFARGLFDWRDFPRSSALFGGRYYVPAVLDFIDAYERCRAPQPSPPDGNERETTWNASKRRGSGGASATAVRRSRIG